MLIVNGFDRVSAPQSERNDSLAGFRMDLDGGVADRQDIAFIGAQRVFDLAQARCNVDSVALGACACDWETDVIGGNTFDYPALHGRSVAAAGYSFCSASARAVERGEVSLEAYPAVDLILGKQRTTPLGRGVCEAAFRTFPPELQAVLRRYLPAAEGFLHREATWRPTSGPKGPRRRGARSPGRCSASTPTGDIPRSADGCGS